MQTEYNLYHSHPMTTRLGAQILAMGEHLTRSKRQRLDELIGEDMLAEILAYNQNNNIKLKPQYILVFDTETTGLIPKGSQSIWSLTSEELATYPYITQLSAVLYDVANNKLEQVFNTYIKIPDHVEIPQIVTDITGITREKCRGGMNIVDALNAFHALWEKSETLIAHNMWFDSKMIMLEYKRNKMYCDVFKDRDALYCTMIQGMRHVGANRFIKLSYLHEHMFGQLDDNVQLHNSLVDTMVCLRCYLALQCGIEMSDKEFYGYATDMR